MDAIEFYDAFRKPEFIMTHSHPIREGDRDVYSVKTKVTVPLLGMVTLGTLYYVGLMKVSPVMFLSEKQYQLLRERRVPLVMRRRKHPTDDEAYYCYPTRSVFERIISM